MYALRYNKNKDANIHIKYIISKYTNAKIKITRNVAYALDIKVNRSISIDEFYKLYEKHVQNQIKKFENDIREEIKLTNTDLLVYYYLKSFSKKLVSIKIEEIANDCKISIATASRAVRKLVQAQKIKVHKIKNKNIYEIIDCKEEPHIETEKQKEYSKTKSISIKRSVKDIEVQTSESDYKNYNKNEKLDLETRYKIYLYRQKYAEELKNLQLKRLTKDDVLFFLINTENLVENESLTIDQTLRIIKYADSHQLIKNPRGWLISRFMIGRGRFYFLLSKSKTEHLSQSRKHENKNNDIEKDTKYIYINKDLMYFAQKYNIPEKDIMSYLNRILNRINAHGDVSYIVEIYLANRLWKDSLSREEKQELISYAKHQIKKFIVPPKPEEVKDTIKSIILSEIRSRYLTLSIEEKIRMKNASQCYDTS